MWDALPKNVMREALAGPAPGGGPAKLDGELPVCETPLLGVI